MGLDSHAWEGVLGATRAPLQVSSLLRFQPLFMEEFQGMSLDGSYSHLGLCNPASVSW